MLRPAPRGGDTAALRVSMRSLTLSGFAGSVFHSDGFRSPRWYGEGGPPVAMATARPARPPGGAGPAGRKEHASLFSRGAAFLAPLPPAGGRESPGQRGQRGAAAALLGWPG